ncbi:MAG TPA: 3'-5' exonuclease [Atopostipes sp.]|nr:3'-5' exonuclease [Atopostipes sp.]
MKSLQLDNDVTTLDFETTGFSAVNHEIIQIGAVKYKDGEEVDRFERFVEPFYPIPWKITQLTGITTEMVMGAPPIQSSLNELNEFLKGETIVAHNASFDMKFLYENLRRHEIDYEEFKAIDTVKLARKSITGLPNYKLPTLKSFLGINVGSHNAIEDCLVTGELYYYCKNVQETYF